MWCLTKDGKEWTCPDESLIPFACVQASDRGEAEKIFNGEAAKKYLESLGFEIQYQEKEPLKDIPKCADWHNWQHRELYNIINNKIFNGIPITDAEREFNIDMYHAEEAATGLL